MNKVFRSNNHLDTFTGSMGLCGAMVCSWMSKLKAGMAVQSQNDIGTIGSLILNQNKYIKVGQDRLFQIYNLQVIDSSGEIDAVEWRRVVDGVAEEGLYYLSLRFSNGSGHAIGVLSTNGSWELFDPNKYLARTDYRHDFTNTLFDLAGKYYQIDLELSSVVVYTLAR
jgi:hypothetical protein